MGQAGLFYYYHTFAKAMTALGEDRFEDAKGQEARLAQRAVRGAQETPAGQTAASSTRATEQFGEADPNLATAFALLALSYAKSPKK